MTGIISAEDEDGIHPLKSDLMIIFDTGSVESIVSMELFTLFKEALGVDNFKLGIC